MRTMLATLAVAAAFTVTSCASEPDYGPPISVKDEPGYTEPTSDTQPTGVLKVCIDDPRNSWDWTTATPEYAGYLTTLWLPGRIGYCTVDTRTMTLTGSDDFV